MKMAIIDSGTTSTSDNEVDKDAFVVTGKALNKQMAVADVRLRIMTEKRKLPVLQLTEKVRECTCYLIFEVLY